MKQSDPLQGQWCVSRQDVNVWVNASSLAIGVFLERDDVAVEDHCWLRLIDDAQNYQRGWTWCSTERHQFGFADADQGYASENRLNERVSLVIGHTNGEGPCTHKGRRRDATPAKIGNYKTIGWRIWIVLHHVEPKHRRPEYCKDGSRWRVQPNQHLSPVPR